MEATTISLLRIANLGMQATYKNFFGGASVLDIPLSNDIPVINGIEPSPTKYILNLGYDYVLTEGISLEPSIINEFKYQFF
ncbi:hypothetical protein [Halpernia sp. GG3]